MTGERIVRLHTCSVCGKEAPWDSRWSWYGSIKDVDDGNPLVKTCSEKCKETLEQIGGGAEKLHAVLHEEAGVHKRRRLW